MKVIIEVKDINGEVYQSVADEGTEEDINGALEVIGDVLTAENGQVNFKDVNGDTLFFRINNIIYCKVVTSHETLDEK